MDLFQQAYEDRIEDALARRGPAPSQAYVYWIGLLTGDLPAAKILF
jgi:hypothetical protein